MRIHEHIDTIHSKLPHVGTTIFAIMSKLANDHKAINLSQGFPDFNCPDKLIGLVNHYMKKGYNQYAPMQGVIVLRERISEKIEQLYGVSYHPETEITITSGATEAIYDVITAVVKQNDEVIVFEPAYDCYVPSIELNGGKPVFVQLHAPDYHIKWDEVEKAISDKTVLMIINTPQNPTGAVLSAEDINRLSAIVTGTNILILSDEVYEHIIFDQLKHQSMMINPILKERSFVVFSFGKTYHSTGWKMGYCVAPEYLTKEFRKIHQFVTFTSNTPVQYALADFMEDKDHYFALPDFYQQKRDKFCNLLAGSGFELLPCKGTYFQLASYKNINSEQDTVFAETLTKQIGVASIPISVFYNDKTDNQVLRFCFAKEEETLERAADKLCKV